jgi:hypothetical protein
MRFESNQSRRSLDCSFSRFNFTIDRERRVASTHLSLATNQSFENWQETRTDEIEKIEW